MSDNWLPPVSLLDTLDNIATGNTDALNPHDVNALTALGYINGTRLTTLGHDLYRICA